jgi:hypothetical protein
LIKDIIKVTNNGTLKWRGNTAMFGGYTITLVDGIVTISRGSLTIDTVADTGGKLLTALGDTEEASTVALKARFARKLAKLAEEEEGDL